MKYLINNNRGVRFPLFNINKMRKFEFTIPEQVTIEIALIKNEVEVDERIKHYTERLNTIKDATEIKEVSELLRHRKEIKKNIKSALKKLL